MKRLALCVLLVSNVIGCSGSSKEETGSSEEETGRSIEEVIAVYESEVRELERLNQAAADVETKANQEIQLVRNAFDAVLAQAQATRVLFQDAERFAFTDEHFEQLRKAEIEFARTRERVVQRVPKCKATIEAIRQQANIALKELQTQMAVQKQHVQKARKARDLALGH